MKLKIPYPRIPEPGLIWNSKAWEVNPRLRKRNMGVKIKTFMGDTIYQCTECGANHDSESEAWQCCDEENEEDYTEDPDTWD
jgi:hypothetical protein